MQAAITEAKRKAREAARGEEIQSLLHDWSEGEYATDEACRLWAERHNPYYRPWPIYNRGNYARRLAERTEGKPHPYVKLPALKTSAGIIRRLSEAIKKARAALNAVREC
jgi:hypothetical protein